MTTVYNSVFRAPISCIKYKIKTQPLSMGYMHLSRYPYMLLYKLIVMINNNY